jgi:probable HAF family extracellular repeat protein
MHATHSSPLTRAIAGILLLAVALPVPALGQSTRYRLVDIGTLGGANSLQTGPSEMVSIRGDAIAQAETIYPTPFGQNGVTGGGPVVHAVRWQDGRATDLGEPAGIDAKGSSSIPTWIDDSGLIAGLTENGLIDPLTGFSQVRAVLWVGQVSLNLCTLGGNASQAFAVNGLGQVVGVALNAKPDDFAQTMTFLPAATQARAFLWQNGVMRDLGTLGGNDAAAVTINPRGQVTGFSYTDASPNPVTGVPTVHPFLWEHGKMRDLGSLGGSQAYPGPLYIPGGQDAAGGVVLNSDGDVAGTSMLAGDASWHAYRWSHGIMRDLGTLGGANSESFAMNEHGDIVGRADFSPKDTHHHAFLWQRGAMTDLGWLPPCLNSTAKGINVRNQIVGETGACPSGGDGHAFISENGRPMVDLNDLVLPEHELTVIGAAYINDRGEIGGLGQLPNGDVHAVVLIPTE